MALDNRQIQAQNQVQTLQLTPQQMLLVKLIELPTVEMEERVRNEIQENPALEEGHEGADGADYDEDPNYDGDSAGEDTSYDSDEDYRTEDDIPEYKLQSHNQSKEERAEEIPFSDTTSFYEALKEQLSEQDLDDGQRAICEYLIGSLDDDGILRKPLSTITDELAIYQDIYASQEQVEQALHTIQEFDPAGLGARSLQECLLIQVSRKREEKAKADPMLDLEYKILQDYYDDFTHKRWEEIAKTLNIGEDQCKEAIAEIARLNPRPGASLGEAMGKNLQQIIPDFIVDCDDNDHINLSLNNDGLPELRVSQEFRQMLSEQAKANAGTSRDQQDAAAFIKQKIDSAQMFIEAVQKRQDTLYRTMQAIISMQRDFFLDGDETQLRPMILKDIAQKTGLDISTISRVSNSKYVQTNFGIYPLKFFFNDGFVRSDGEERSVKEIHNILTESVASENKKHPLTDEELCKILHKHGFDVARRTVAKYRDQLHIPVARLRK